MEHNEDGMTETLRVLQDAKEKLLAMVDQSNTPGGLALDEWCNYWQGDDWKSDGLTQENMVEDLRFAAKVIRQFVLSAEE